MRRYYLVVTLLVCSAAITTLPGTSAAQVNCQNQELPKGQPWDPAAPETTLLQLHMADCLGGPADPSAVAKAVRQVIAVKDPSDSTRFRPAAERGLLLLIEHLVAPLPGLPIELQTELLAKLQAARAGLGSGQPPAVMPSWELDPATGRVPASSAPPLGRMRDVCVEPTSSCAQTFVATREVLRFATLARAALAVSERPVISAHLAETSRRLRKWNIYFEGTRSQYIWELAVNGARMGDTRELVEGVRRGFREVPSSQILLLHPSVAFEYARGDPEGNRFAGAVIVDLLGFNKWSWNEDGSMGPAFGASVILAAGDRANVEDAGFGLMVHVNHRFSAGVTFRGENRTVIVSGDVAQLWTSVSELRKRRLMTGR